ncbi:hypothetical protein Tco_0341653 [Tanacetum coccineum]
MHPHITTKWEVSRSLEIKSLATLTKPPTLERVKQTSIGVEPKPSPAFQMACSQLTPPILSSLRAQLKQQQDEVINKINTLWKVVSEKLDNAPTRDIDKHSMVHAKVASYNHQENRAILNKGIIKSPSKLLSPKYQAQSSLGEEGRNSSSLIHIHFINTITIIRKEDEPNKTEPLGLNEINSNNHNLDKGNDKAVGKESKTSMIKFDEGGSSDQGINTKISNDRLEDGEWM